MMGLKLPRFTMSIYIVECCLLCSTQLRRSESIFETKTSCFITNRKHSTVERNCPGGFGVKRPYALEVRALLH